MRIAWVVKLVVEIAVTPILFLIALSSRRSGRPVDVGVGPLPLINNVYHVKALHALGYTAETYVSHVWHITEEFDVRFDEKVTGLGTHIRARLRPYRMWLWAIWRYRVLVFYFDGGPLGQGTAWLHRIEPTLLSVARVKTIVLPYGSDVQTMIRSSNLQFKHSQCVQYPRHKMQKTRIESLIDIWTKGADHIVSGCEWVDYMYHWDTLLLSHFSVDVTRYQEDVQENMPQEYGVERPLRLLHAPNHREVKGTNHLQNAVRRLQMDGLSIELELLERVNNKTVQERIREADVIVDQLVVGWYAMFAIEAMASGKPVMCRLRQDLVELYLFAGIIESEDELPLINADFKTIEAVLRRLYGSPAELRNKGMAGRKFVEKYHSTDVLGARFRGMLERMEVTPRAEGARTDG